MKSSKKASAKKSRKTKVSRPRFWARATVAGSLLVVVALSVAGNFYVRHPADWLAAHRSPLTAPLEYFGNRSAFITDALGLTGRDTVNTPDDPIPTGRICFAGEPRRVGSPAPADITVLDRGEFKIGWSPTLRHPVWVAYHVPRAARHASGRRPNFSRDRNVASSPSPQDYRGTGYDRGHMVPNRAIVTRFGPEVQRKTFQMTNIAPQRPGLNRGPWREMEQRIADLWTAKYGEIWVVAGSIPAVNATNRAKLGDTSITIPEKYYMVIAAQTKDDVRVLAVLMDQNANRWDFPVHSIVSVDELERLTGLDFFPDMQKSLQMSLESDTPTRLWPIRLVDALKLVLLRFS